GPRAPVARVWRRNAPLDGVRAAVRAGGVRLVHVNHHGGLFGGGHLPALLRALAADGVRTVVTMHAPNQRDPEIRAVGEAADAIVVHGEGPRLEGIANGVAPERVHVVPHGIRAPATDDVADVRARLGFRPGEKVVASLGFLQPHKGVHEVIRAVAALRDRLPLRYLALGGAQPGDPTAARYKAECLAEAARLGVADRVTILDEYLPDDALARSLRAADVIVLPYQTAWWESSAAAREALASGRPVVTSPALAFHDLDGAVFRTTGGFPLAEAILAVLENPALAGALVAAGARLAAEHSWPRVAERHRALWDAVLAAPPRAPDDRPRVLFMLREHAHATGGGDVIVAAATADGLDGRRVAIVRREGGEVTADATLVHLFNFSTYATTHAHAARAVALGLPYVVTALYEDWPAFKL